MAKQKTTRPTAKKPKPKAAPPAASPMAVSERSGPRRLKRPTYRSWRYAKRIKHPVKLPNVWRLSRAAAGLLWDHKGLFAGIIGIYGLLNLLLVQGIAGGTDVQGIKALLQQSLHGQLAGLSIGVTIFANLLTSSGNANSTTSGSYQFFLVLICSLAVIWALRQVLAGSRLRVRDAYYRGMFPLVPFVLVLSVIGLQLLPLLIGSSLYTLVITNGIAVYAAEKFVWALLYVSLALLSLYMVSSSVFALYIVTLPDMTPLKALRSARELVRYRRWTVLRKIFFLPILLLAVAAVIMIPVILLLTPLAQWIFFMLTMAAVAAVHSYMYVLYRELLNE